MGWADDAMQHCPSTLLSEAVEAIGSLPGVGRRSALRLALHLLRQRPEQVRQFTSAIDRLREEVQYCELCHMVSDGPRCAICADTRRDPRTLCVVESVRDVMSIEATGQYHGLYHVLGGIISPIAGIGPSDLTLDQLRARVQAMERPAEAELILALPGDVEGETTAFYIYRQVEASGIRVTSLARGLGFGDNLEYADSLTLGRSLLNRQNFKPQ